MATICRCLQRLRPGPEAAQHPVEDGETNWGQGKRTEHARCLAGLARCGTAIGSETGTHVNGKAADGQYLTGTLTTVTLGLPDNQEVRASNLIFVFGSIDNQLVVGGASLYPSGAATIAVGARVAEAGYSVAIIDPEPLGIWPNNYGVWVDENTPEERQLVAAAAPAGDDPGHGAEPAAQATGL